MKKFFESDSFLKIASVAIAVILWLYIIVVLDPAIEVEVRELPIQFVGQEQMEANDISVVSESATTVNVKVKGSRKKMGRYDMKTIIAKVDMSDVSKVGRHKLPVEIVVPFENAGISSQSHYHVELLVEKTLKKELELDVATEGNLEKDYISDNLTVTPQKITIRGPESVVGKIGKAGVVLNYDNANGDIEQTLPVILYDSDNRVLVSQDALLKRISQDVAEATVSCSVVKLRTVEISPQIEAGTGDEREFLSTNTYEINPSTIQIYGDDEETIKISEILTEKVPVAKLMDSQRTKVKLSIPKNVKVLGDVAEVEITISDSQGPEKE